MYDREIVLRKDSSNGYLYFIDKEHPLASAVGKVYYHRHVASLKEGRWLRSDEHVHHLDGDKENNEEENVVVVTSSRRVHFHREEIKKRRCLRCNAWFRPSSREGKYCSTGCANDSQKRFDVPDEELTELVWSYPLVVLAKRFGVSDTAIRKRCMKAGIERPDSGYWLRGRKGHSSSQTVVRGKIPFKGVTRW